MQGKKANVTQEREIVAKMRKALENERLDPLSRANKEDRLIDSLLRLGQDSEAREIIEASINDSKLDRHLRQSRRARLVEFYRRRGENGKALTILEQEVQINDSEQIVRSEARHSMVDIYLEEGSLDRAITILRHEIDDETIDTTLRADGQIRLASILADNNRSDEAAEILRAAVERYKDIPWLVEELREQILLHLNGSGSLKEREEIEFLLKDYRRKQEHRRQVNLGIDQEFDRKNLYQRRRSKSRSSRR